MAWRPEPRDLHSKNKTEQNKANRTEPKNPVLYRHRNFLVWYKKK